MRYILVVSTVGALAVLEACENPTNVGNGSVVASATKVQASSASLAQARQATTAPAALDQAGSLGGVEGFRVEVGGASVGPDESGVTTRVDALTSEIEEALKSRGIHVYKAGDNSPVLGPGVWAALRVGVTSVNQRGSSAVLLDLSVLQPVRFASDIETTGFATTWKDARVIGWGSSVALFHAVLAEAVEKLCSEYLAARSAWVRTHHSGKN